MTPDNALTLQARIVELEQENQRLRAEQDRGLQPVLHPPSLVLESITDAFIALDRDFRYLWLNAEAERLCGMPRDELLGCVIWDLSPEFQESVIEAKCREVIETGNPAEISSFYAPWNRWCFVKIYPTPAGGLAMYYRDITVQKQAEEAVRKQAELLSQVYDSIIRTDLDGIITSWNHGARQIFGYTAEEAVGRPVSMLYFPEDQSSLMPRVFDPVISAGQCEIQLRNRRKSGEECFIRLSLSLLRDESGAPYEVLGVALDLTERKKLEADLRASEGRLLLAQAAANVGTWDWNMLSDTCVWSEGMGPLFGLQRGTSVGSFQSLLPYVVPEDQSVLMGAVAKAIADRSGYYVEFRVRWPDGSRHWVSGQGRIDYDESGQPCRMIGLGADITARKLAEEALRTSEQRFHTALLNSPVVVFNQDKELRYTWIYNPALGYTPEQVIGKRDVEIFQRLEDAEVSEALKRQVIDTGIGLRQQVTIHHQGIDRFYDLTIEPLRDANGRIEGVTCAASDITAQKTSEQRLTQRADAFARVNADLEHLAYAIGHDLKEPLRTISSFTELLSRTYKGKLDERADEFLEFIQNASTRMNTMVAELTNYFRITTDQGDGRESVSLERVLESSISSLRAVFQETQATITHGPLPEVVISASQIEHVFQNLIANALKYRNPGAPTRIHVAAHRLESEWVIAINDNGIGFDPGRAEFIFKLFKRLHTEEYAGTGIGLAICKRVIENCGGRIWAESTPGSGSTFSFTLPA